MARSALEISPGGPARSAGCIRATRAGRAGSPGHPNGPQGRFYTHCTDREQFLSPTRIAQCLTSYRHIIGITRLQSRPRGLFSARPHTHRHQPCPSRPPSLLPRVGSKSTWVRTRSFACSTVSQTAVDGFRGDETAETVALRWRVLSVVIH